MANFDNQLLRMKSLMTYGAVNENKQSNNGAMEYHAIGADGKSYGIIRENQKFYIKVAPQNKQTIVESYDYIGGFNNKKAYEYSSYSNALKNFELKMMSLNEAHNAKVNIDNLQQFETDGEVMTESTKEMMSEIARQRQIMNNVSAILNESTTISCKNTGVPEAPKTATFNDKIGKPFEETAKAELDGDFKKTAESPEKQGEPFGDTAKPEKEKDAEYVPNGSVANQKPKGGKVARVDESTKKVWEMMAKLDKTFTLNESCDEWGSCGLPSSEGVGSPDGHLMEDDENIAGFADDNFEATQGDVDDVESEPDFEDEEEDFDFEDEGEDFDFEDDDFDVEDEDFDAKDDDFGAEDMDAEADMEMDVDDDGEIGGDSEIDALRAEIESLKAEIAALKGDEPEFDEEMPEDAEGEMGDEPEFDDEMPEGTEGEMGDEPEFDDEMPEGPETEMEEEFNPETEANYDDFDESILDGYDEDDEFESEDELEFDDEFGISESRKQELMPIVENLVKTMKKKKLTEDKLNDFGKHPGYRKKPMTLPATGSDTEGDSKDWNDDSVYSEEPFGSKIGDSAPYEKIVQTITDSVMESLKRKKKN